MDNYDLWEDCADALDAFMVVQTQFDLDAAGRPCRMDYAGVRAGLGMAGIVETPALFADLRVCEMAAVKALRG